MSCTALEQQEPTGRSGHKNWKTERGWRSKWREDSTSAVSKGMLNAPSGKVTNVSPLGNVNRELKKALPSFNAMLWVPLSRQKSILLTLESATELPMGNVLEHCFAVETVILKSLCTSACILVSNSITSSERQPFSPYTLSDVCITLYILSKLL